MLDLRGWHCFALTVRSAGVEAPAPAMQERRVMQARSSAVLNHQAVKMHGPASMLAFSIVRGRQSEASHAVCAKHRLL